jgi:hypothetical protein
MPKAASLISSGVDLPWADFAISLGAPMIWGKAFSRRLCAQRLRPRREGLARAREAERMLRKPRTQLAWATAAATLALAIFAGWGEAQQADRAEQQRRASLDNETQPMADLSRVALDDHRAVEALNFPFGGAVFSKDRSRMLSWSEDKTLRLWNSSTGKQIGPAIQHNGLVVSALLSTEYRTFSDETLLMGGAITLVVYLIVTGGFLVRRQSRRAGLPDVLKSGPSPKEAHQESTLQSAFFFALEGDNARCDQVRWGKKFDLVFNYGNPPRDRLAELKGNELQRVVESEIALRVDISLRGGLAVTDGIVGRTVNFKGGSMVDGPLRFHLQSPEKHKADSEESGIGVTLSVDHETIYEFFLDVRLVEWLGDDPCPNITLDLDLMDVVDRDRKPRDASVFIVSEGDVWRIHWNIDNKDSRAELTSTVSASKLEAAYQDDILRDLRGIAGKAIWKSITEDLELPPEAAFAAAARECMQKAMTAGWKLYDHFSQDSVFKTLLGAIEKLPDGSRLSIKTDGAVFPWELFYPHEYVDEYPKENYDPTRFWGARFHIESLLLADRNTDERVPTKYRQPGKLYVTMGMNNSIDDEWADWTPRPVQLQRNFFNSALRSRGTYVDQYEDILNVLRQPDSSSLIYFFCHGTASKLDFGKFKDPVTAVRVMGHSYPGWPIVFLNACDAGNISPLSFYSFRTKFRTKKASGLLAHHSPSRRFLPRASPRLCSGVIRSVSR